MPPNSLRLLRALAREGLQVRRDGPLYIVKLASTLDAPGAEVLLPDSLPVEAEALRQLASRAAPGGDGSASAGRGGLSGLGRRPPEGGGEPGLS
jgi:hypothetical protein